MSDRHRVTQMLGSLWRSRSVQVVAGTAAGVLIVLFAVVLSALVFGTYGWGLFVLTPLVVGFTTGYLVNRHELLSFRATTWLVLLSAALGCFGLILFALEGLICLLMAAPLAGLLAMLGGNLGRNVAKRHGDGGHPLYCVALLPAMFAADAISPPSVPMLTDESIVIAAPSTRVWQAVTSNEPIRERPTLAGRLGLAYPLASRLSGQGLGSLRIGYFSTGQAQERIIDWDEGRILGFMVLSQPPAMEEMSPYRHVHAPHIDGYFETGETRFELNSLSGGRTRLTIRAAHRLRIDPILYWEPIARWAIRDNTQRVLRDIKAKSETAV